MGIDTYLAEELYESNELDWFLKELVRVKEIRDISYSMQIAEAIRMGNVSLQGKKGPQLYNNWMKRMRNRIAKNKGNPEPTIFEKIRGDKVKETLFDKLRRL